LLPRAEKPAIKMFILWMDEKCFRLSRQKDLWMVCTQIRLDFIFVRKGWSRIYGRHSACRLVERNIIEIHSE